MRARQFDGAFLQAFAVLSPSIANKPFNLLVLPRNARERVPARHSALFYFRRKTGSDRALWGCSRGGDDDDRVGGYQGRRPTGVNLLPCIRLNANETAPRAVAVYRRRSQTKDHGGQRHCPATSSISHKQVL